MTMPSWKEFTAYLEEFYAPGLNPTLRALPCPHEGVPDDIWSVAKSVFPDPEAWLQNPIPQLQGRSALEAIRRGKGDEIRGILQQVASFYLPPPEEVVPWEDWDRGVEVDAHAPATAAAAAPGDGADGGDG